MTEKNYIFADVPVTISAHDPYVTRMCREYEAETPGVRIEATPEEIERERAGMGEDFPGGYLESLAVYRKICEEMLFFHTWFGSRGRWGSVSFYCAQRYGKVYACASVEGALRGEGGRD